MDTNTYVPFVIFGSDHLLTLLIIAVVAIVLPLAVRQAADDGLDRSVAAVLAAALVLHELFKIWFRVDVLGLSLAESLPLHLCNLAAFVVAYVLVRRSYSAYEIAYFWALCGTLPALVTPDLQQGFPSLLFVVFFVGHALVIVGVIYATVVFGFRPTLRSLAKAIAVTLVYAAVVGPLNFLLGTNYLYLRHKPEQATLIDYLGPWPWYILALMAVGAVFCLVSLAPFALTTWLSKRRDRAHRARPLRSVR